MSNFMLSEMDQHDVRLFHHLIALPENRQYRCWNYDDQVAQMVKENPGRFNFALERLVQRIKLNTEQWDALQKEKDALKLELRLKTEQQFEDEVKNVCKGMLVFSPVILFCIWALWFFATKTWKPVHF